MELTRFTCKSCGATLEAKGEVVVCAYCGTRWTVPQPANPAALEFLRMGEHDLDICRFEEAYSAYQKAAELDPKDPEAQFGMAVASFKVQYLKDETKDPPRLQPICHEISKKRFTEDAAYKRAIALASPVRREVYEARGKEIDAIRSEFLRLKESGLSYDCFLCVKVSDDKGGTTQDSHEALRIYNHLKKRGYAPFYSEEETQGREGKDYEALILYALYSSKCMLIVCSDEEYLKTRWVKNEYTRFSAMVLREEKALGAISFVFRGAPIERLPGIDGKLQGIDLARPDAYSRIEEYVGAFVAQAATPAEISRKEYGAVSYSKKRAERRGVQKRELAISGGEISVSDRAKLKIVEDFLGRGDFANAQNFIEGMLRENPGNGESYFLRFLARCGLRNAEEFASCEKEIESYEDFERALSALGDAGRRGELYGYLYRYCAERKFISAYNEYIELPESGEKEIAALTDLLYQEALKTKDRTMFDAVIRTVTDPDLYIEHSFRFAKLLPKKEAVVYYKNILAADEGNHEAQLEVFLAEYGFDSKKIFAFCADPKNAEKVEEKLFSYGYNAVAEEALFQICLEGVAEPEAACAFMDLLLTLTPKEENARFSQQLRTFSETLVRAGAFGFAGKYNELLIAMDPLDDDAYFRRVLLKNGYKSPVCLLQNAENGLYSDPDYSSALSSYAERHAGNNLYIDINDALAQGYNAYPPDVRAYLVEALEGLKKEDLPKLKKFASSAILEEAHRIADAAVAKNGCKELSELYKLDRPMKAREEFERARKYAGLVKDKFATTLKELLAGQEAAAQQNLEDEQRRQEEEAAKEEERVAHARAEFQRQINAKRATACFVAAIVLTLAFIVAIFLAAAQKLGPVNFFFTCAFNSVQMSDTLAGFITVLFIAAAIAGGVCISKKKTIGVVAAIALMLIIPVVVTPIGLARYAMAGAEKGGWYYSAEPQTIIRYKDIKINDTIQGRAFIGIYTESEVSAFPAEYGGAPITIWGGGSDRIFKYVDYEKAGPLKQDTVVVPEGVVAINGSAFYSCENRVIVLPESLIYIGSEAFYGASKLESITIPASVQYVGAEAFGCWRGTLDVKVTVPFRQGETPAGWDARWAEGLPSSNIIYAD